MGIMDKGYSVETAPLVFDCKNWIISQNNTPGNIYFTGGSNCSNITQNISNVLVSTVGSWNFIGVSKVNNEVRYYMDGRWIATHTLARAFSSNTSPLWIGAVNDGSSRYFKGTLDDIRMYRRPLQATEMLKMYRTTASITTCCPNMNTLTTYSATTCGTAGVTLSVSGGFQYRWYSVSVGGTVLSNDSFLTLSSISGTSIYYVESHQGICQSLRYPVTVTSVAFPPLPLVATVSLCGVGQGLFNGSATGVVHWYTSTSDGISVATGNTWLSPIVTVSSLFFARNLAMGCYSPYRLALVEVYPIPSISGIAGATSVCPSVLTVNYTMNTISGHLYSWTATGGTISGATNTPSIQVNWGLTNTLAGIQAVVTSPNLCKSPTFILPVKVTQFIETQKPSGDTSVCFGTPNTLTYTHLPTNGSQYRWDVSGPALITTVSGNASILLTPTIAGLVKISLYETVSTSTDFCVDWSDTLYVYIREVPSPSQIIQGPASICQSSTDNNYTLSGLAHSVFNWSVAGGLFQSANTGTVVGITSNTAGTVMVRAQETTQYGCKGNLLVATVTSDPLPITSVVGVPELFGGATVHRCNDYRGNFRNNQLVARGFTGSTYSWVTSNPTLTVTSEIGTTPGAIMAPNTPFPSVIGWLFLVESPAVSSACPSQLFVSSAQLVFHQFPNPDLDIVAPARICLGEELVLKDGGNGQFTIWEATAFDPSQSGFANNLALLQGSTSSGLGSVALYDPRRFVAPYGSQANANDGQSWRRTLETDTESRNIARYKPTRTGTYTFRVAQYQKIEKGYLSDCISVPNSIQIEVNEPKTTKILNILDTLCNEDANKMVFTASGFAGSTFEWGIEPLASIHSEANYAITTITGRTMRTHFDRISLAKIKLTERTNAANTCPNFQDSINISILQNPDTTIAILGADNVCRYTGRQYTFVYPGNPESSYTWRLTNDLSQFVKDTIRIELSSFRENTALLQVQEVSLNG